MIQIEFGKRIKELREYSGLSQEKFALKIGMDRTYYASVESGKRNISLRNIEKIANGFDISIAQLFTEIKNVN
ncbi:helix-turn-helix domain-containing protein [Streptococcus parasanguinis]|uniref:helix-turn-helix domain-containing protein n=1 Tax=Streptococcus parasanguinis TaxID=1318 RepID=UPI0022E718CB|nr:helix-turn-helix transcriptional regulator [Streptococcus parasanguinis]